jgi:hypothetical protein
MKTSIITLLSILFFISCSTTYKISYDTYIKDSQKKDLNYSDDKFDFTFIPVSNGIWFSVKNKTSKTAYLVWDKTYFIEPTGNSFKALDVDALNTVEEVARKENNESLIPANSIYARFTTPKNNLSKFAQYDYVTINNIFTNNIYTSSSYYEFFEAGAYWKTTIQNEPKNNNYGKDSWDRPAYEGDLLERNTYELKDFLINNNNLGLGLYIKYENENYEYRFDFKIKQANIYEDDGSSKIIIRVLKEENNFEVK